MAYTKKGNIDEFWLKGGVADLLNSFFNQLIPGFHIYTSMVVLKL